MLNINKSLCFIESKFDLRLVFEGAFTIYLPPTTVVSANNSNVLDSPFKKALQSLLVKTDRTAGYPHFRI